MERGTRTGKKRERDIVKSENKMDVERKEREVNLLRTDWRRTREEKEKRERYWHGGKTREHTKKPPLDGRNSRVKGMAGEALYSEDNLHQKKKKIPTLAVEANAVWG